MFEEGESFGHYPLRLVWVPIESQDVLVQVAFSVSKRRFKLAVDRNRAKRVIREAYRLNKQILIDYLEALAEPQAYGLMFIYLDKQLPDFHQVNTEMEKALNRMVNKLK